MQLAVVTVYPVANYHFGVKEGKAPKVATPSERTARLQDKYGFANNAPCFALVLQRSMRSSKSIHSEAGLDLNFPGSICESLAAGYHKVHSVSATIHSFRLRRQACGSADSDRKACGGRLRRCYWCTCMATRTCCCCARPAGPSLYCRAAGCGPARAVCFAALKIYDSALYQQLSLLASIHIVRFLQRWRV